MALTRRSLFALDFGRRARPGAAWLRVHRVAMACRFEVTLAPSDTDHVDAARQALDVADRLEAQLSVFRPMSELTSVNNRAADEAVRTTPELFALLQQCSRLHAETEGAFDITSTALSRCWGFLRREGRVPSAAEIDSARAVVGMQHVSFDSTTSSIRFARKGVALNLGAIGKGYAVDRMGDSIRACGIRHALVSSGGSSVLAVGGRGRGWCVDIRSPRAGRDRLARLFLRNGALGTSGTGEQFVLVDGLRYGHVIDPRTGWPARSVLSASVVTSDATSADALSTAFLIGGPDLAERYCREHPGTLAVLALTAHEASTRIFGSFAGAEITT